MCRRYAAPILHGGGSAGSRPRLKQIPPFGLWTRQIRPDLCPEDDIEGVLPEALNPGIQLGSLRFSQILDLLNLIPADPCISVAGLV